MIKAYLIVHSAGYIYLQLIRYKGEAWWAAELGKGVFTWAWKHGVSFDYFDENVKKPNGVFLGHVMNEENFSFLVRRWRVMHVRQKVVTDLKSKKAPIVMINDAPYWLFRKYKPGDLK